MNWADGQGWLTAGGKRLEWASHGAAPDGDMPVIVLLHEGLGCVALWRRFPQALHRATGLPVFVYSRAGYGRSDTVMRPRPPDYMTREAVDVLPELLTALGAQRVILLGHSDGATIAAEYAGRVGDDRLCGLILIAPHFFREASGLAQIAQVRADDDATDLRARLGKYHDDPDAAFLGWAEAWLDPAGAGWDVSHVLGGLQVATLVIQGRDDAYGTLAQVDAVVDRSPAPVETLVVDGAGHAPHLEAPDLVLPAVARFAVRMAAAG